MARKPTPSSLKLLKGERRPSRVNQQEPQPAGELGPVPERLDEDAQTAWTELAPRVWWATESDREGFELLTLALGDSRRLRRELAKESAVVQGSRGEVRNPKSYLLREAEDRAARLLAEFGLTPSSRTRVQVPERPKANDPLAQRPLAHRR